MKHSYWISGKIYRITYISGAKVVIVVIYVQGLGYCLFRVHLLSSFAKSSYSSSAFQLVVQYLFWESLLIDSVYMILPLFSVFIYFLIKWKDILFSTNIFIPHVIYSTASFNKVSIVLYFCRVHYREIHPTVYNEAHEW